MALEEDFREECRAPSLIALLFILGTALASPTEKHGGCNFAAHGIPEEVFVRFFDRLKKAGLSGDKNAFAQLVIYPLTVSGKKRISNADQLAREFDSIFTEKVRAAIRKQQLDQIFCNSEGVMFGEGEVWIGVRGRKIGIKAINRL